MKFTVTCDICLATSSKSWYSFCQRLLSEIRSVKVLSGWTIGYSDQFGTPVLSVIEPEWERKMKIEEVLKLIEGYLRESEEAVKNPKLANLDRMEARGARSAYAHCIGLLKACIEKKGWT